MNAHLFTLYHEPIGAGYTDTDFDEDNQFGEPRDSKVMCFALYQQGRLAHPDKTWHVLEKEHTPYGEHIVRQYTLIDQRWTCTYEYDGSVD